MEQIQNPRSVDSHPIWLKSVRFEPDWLDLTNPWLKEVIKSDPELIFSILYGEFFPPSLLHTFWLIWMSFGGCFSQQVEVSIRSALRLTIALSETQIWLSKTQIRHWWTLLQLQWSISLGFVPPWAGSPIFCINKAQAASSKLVRTGIEVLLLLYYCYCSFEIKIRFGGKTVLCHCMWGWSLPFFTELTCIYVHNLLIACGFNVKIGNKLIIILIGNVLFSNLLAISFLWCMFRDLDSACSISLYACYSESLCMY